VRVSAAVARRVTELLGVPVRDAVRAGGGAVGEGHRVELTDGRTLFAKTPTRARRADRPAATIADAGPDADPGAGSRIERDTDPETDSGTTPGAGSRLDRDTDPETDPGNHILVVEAAGLRWLAEPGAAPVPEVLAAAPDILILPWLAPAAPTAVAAERFGRDLAALHRAGAATFGADSDGYIGPLPLDNTPAPDWPEFYATRRLVPYLRAAVDRGAVSAHDAAAVETVLRRLPELAGPAEPPSRIHGDLWAGNICWSSRSTGREGNTEEVTAWLVDPAAHGGHRETDLAMLALFGAPQLDRILAAYQEVAPLAAGWRSRVPLHQLHPLLVHSALFGSGYGAQAGAAARSALG
jgi:fructosamine-3-kinase